MSDEIQKAETSLAPKVSTALIAEIAQLLAAGKSTAHLVAEGKLSQHQLDYARRKITQQWQQSFAIADPAGWVALELARLEAITAAAADRLEQSNDEEAGVNAAQMMSIMLKASSERRKLLGIDAPQRKELVIKETPKELVNEILDADFTESEIEDEPK